MPVPKTKESAILRRFAVQKRSWKPLFWKKRNRTWPRKKQQRQNAQ